MPSANLLRVGNDVVDLTHVRTRDKSSDERFLARVFTDSERAGIRRARDPDLDVWCRWAAKEAAFKVVSKLLDSPPTFAHTLFETEWVSESESAEHTGVVSYGDRLISIQLEARPGSLVHSIAWSTPDEGGRPKLFTHVGSVDDRGMPWGADTAELERRLTDRELAAVHSRASAAVRVGAKSMLADMLTVDENDIEIVCAPGAIGRMPPFVFLNGKPAGADVSLTHDGPWIAWAVWARTGE